MAKRYKMRQDTRSSTSRQIRVEDGLSQQELKHRPGAIKYTTAKSKPKKSRKSQPPTRKSICEERFDKAFLISLVLIAILSLLVFIPFIGPLMVLTLVPYIACNIGCRYVSKRNGIQVGILIGIIWSIIQFYLLFQILNLIKISVTDPAIRTTLDLFIIILIFMATIIFCIIGGYTGGAKFELETKEKASLKGIELQTG
jgi:hypothetical protein